MTGVRGQLAAWIERPAVQRLIIGVIIFNAILLGMETSNLIMARAGLLVTLLDRICLGIFAVEIAAKLYAHRGRFFRDGWNVADFIIVAVSLIPGASTL
ncbi:MAG: ion transporter, partial [Boseongicola sp. SB0676_bin_33]|nr:ion transporter [Boseongicola sp. SB0676_bin_33]